MSSTEQRRAFRATWPSKDGLARLGEAIGEEVDVIEQLHGGVATSTHGLRTPTRSLVLKRYDHGDTTAPLEWERLQVAKASVVPTPEPVALDLDGGWFGVSALVMSRLKGTATYPVDIDALAGALVDIHATPLPDAIPAVLHRPPYYEAWKPIVEYPSGLHDALAELRSRAAGLPHVLNHADFHPGNVLSIRGTITGVVDWSGARLAPRGFDVAIMRSDLAIHPGPDAADAFLGAYERRSGASVQDLPFFDAFAAARVLDHGAGWVDAWNDTGIDITMEHIRTTALAFVASALSNIQRLRTSG